MQPGSPEWRDNQETSFNSLLENPDKWEFNPTEDETRLVLEAYHRFREMAGPTDYPDTETIRLTLSNSAFNKQTDEGPEINLREMTKFFTDFVKDMPEIMRSHAGLGELGLIWAGRKIGSILLKANLPYRVWEEREILSSGKSYVTLRRAADQLEAAENEGYALYHFEVKGDMLTWNMRKGRMVPGDVQPITGANDQ